MSKEIFTRRYVGLLANLEEEIKEIDDYRKLPAPSVPGVGRAYWNNPRMPKIAFVAKDLGTPRKIGNAFDDLSSYVSFYSEALDDLDILFSWPTHYGTYGSMILGILSGIYGVSVEDLKSGKYTEILTSFVDAVQNFKAINNAFSQLSVDVWKKLNETVSRLNKLSLLLETTNPDVVIITSWDIDDYFDVTDFVELKSEYHLRLLKHTERNQYIIHTSHPRSWVSDFEDKPFERRIAQIVSILKHDIRIDVSLKS